MKKIEKFGAWITDNWFLLVPVAMLGICIPIWVFAPKHVSLSEKEFKCISTSPDGIGSKCDVYERRVR